jgi:hypothetical protein
MKLLFAMAKALAAMVVALTVICAVVLLIPRYPEEAVLVILTVAFLGMTAEFYWKDKP